MGDWAILRRKMQSLGVTHYTIDGQPGRRVVFSCLIPLAGRQAVSQRFEAEGDDDFQAAQAAMRRIALWRAAGSPLRLPCSVSGPTGPARPLRMYAQLTRMLKSERRLARLCDRPIMTGEA